MKTFTFDENLFSDLYKDAYGFRPRGHEFYEASDMRKQELWDQTCDALEEELEREKAAKVQAVEDFEALLDSVVASGAGDVETALRWLLSAEEWMENSQDVEQFFWNHGVLFTQYGQRMCTLACAALGFYYYKAA